MRFKRTLAVAAATVGSLAAVGLPATSAHAVGAVTSVTLPMSYYSDILVDPVNQHVFITGSGGVFSSTTAHIPASSMMVTDYSGQTVTTTYSGQTVATIPGTSGDGRMTMSADDSTIYAAASSYVDTVSTSTLADITRYFTGSGVEVESAVGFDGKIWFGYQPTYPGTTGAIPAGIGMIDPSVIPTTYPANDAGKVIGPGESAATVTFNATNDPAGTWAGAPLLAVTTGGELVAAGPYGQGPIELASYDVSSGSATVLAPPVTLASGGNVQDMQITPDGKDVVVASLSPDAQQVFQISDMSLVGQYPTTAFPGSVAIASDGTVVAGASSPTSDIGDAYVFAPGGSAPLNTITFGSSSPVLDDAGLAITPDGSDLFAITSPAYSSSSPNPTLNIIPDPAQTASTLSVTGPATAKQSAAVTLTGTLGGVSPYAGGQVLEVTRTDPEDPNGVALPDVTTAADGSFTITDTPPTSQGNTETVTYQVSYAGDPYLTASTASAAVTVGPGNS